MIIIKATHENFKELEKIKIEFYLWECKHVDELDPKYIHEGLGIKLSKNLQSENYRFFIAIDDNNAVVGFSAARIEQNPSFMKQKSKGHLLNLYIKPEHRKLGIAKKLIDKTLDWFNNNNISDLEITVSSHNKNAHKYYEKLGFDDFCVELKKIKIPTHH